MYGAGHGEGRRCWRLLPEPRATQLETRTHVHWVWRFYFASAMIRPLQCVTGEKATIMLSLRAFVASSKGSLRAPERIAGRLRPSREQHDTGPEPRRG